VGIDIYPQSGLIVAHKLDNNPGIGLYSLRTFDGNMFIFPRMDYRNHLSYTDATRDPFTVNDNTGEITTVGRYNQNYTFTLKDVNPQWIKDKKIGFHFNWYFYDLSKAKTGGEYVPFKYDDQQ